MYVGTHFFVSPALLNYAGLCISASRTAEWPVTNMTEDHSIYPHGIFTAVAYILVRCSICIAVSTASRHLMRRSSSVSCDNTLSQVIRCIYCMSDGKGVHRISPQSQQRKRQFHLGADVRSVSIRHTPPTCRRTCQSHLGIRSTLPISPVIS